MTDRIRLDKWLWQARFFKTRTLAARVVGDGRVRVNGERTEKPAVALQVGDVLTFPQGRQVRVVAVLAFGERRGPAAEAAGLYEDRTPSAVPRSGPRPTGRERRRLDERIAYGSASAAGGPLEPPEGGG